MEQTLMLDLGSYGEAFKNIKDQMLSKNPDIRISLSKYYVGDDMIVYELSDTYYVPKDKYIYETFGGKNLIIAVVKVFGITPVREEIKKYPPVEIREYGFCDPYKFAEYLNSKAIKLESVIL